MTTRISPTLVRLDAGSDRGICCAACGHVLSPADSAGHWKDNAVLQTASVAQLPGWSAAVHPDLVLRQFVCNGCGHLLDSEIALKEDPFLYDSVSG
ncbi:hypothetical protein H0484_14105 [Pusillimonas sp. CC-YST705]|uniref:Acetone carboxylase gamma subunit n=1 Tax=Mesopusillimonas faecipullorum TaxID=2755040 RepID=A0ABS8CGB4_9BURK|nr:hypothetical protein [Mesopusillimonas faecipullorum]MCB5364877.1 hypothetical protein [Mesopusillimonas faecipullorum]